MSDDQPIFSTKIISEDQPKKRTVRRHGMTKKNNDRGDSQNTKEINERLTAIYQDDNGKIPNMKQITIKKSYPFLKTVSLTLLGGAVLAVLAWAGFLLLPSSGRFSENDVSLTVQGPEHLGLGTTSTYYIAYKNNHASAIKNATLNIYYPAGFVFGNGSPAPANAGHNEWKLGTIAANQEGTVTIVGQNYGTINEQKSWRVFLNYRPENFNSEMQKAATLNTVIDSSAFSLVVSGPDKASVGSDVEYTFSVHNNGDWNPAALELAPLLPANFTVASSTPPLNNNNRWQINTFPTGDSSSTQVAALKDFTFKLRGHFSESGEKSGTIKGVLYLPVLAAKQSYSIADTTISSELIKNGLSFNLAINGSENDSEIQPDDTLNITVHLKNTSSQNITNAKVNLALDAPAIKKQSMLGWPQLVDQYNGDVMGGQISDDVRRGKITWDSKKIPALSLIKPNDEINIDIRLPIKNAKDFDFSSAKGFVISANAGVTFNDAMGSAHTLGSNPIDITLNSDFKFENRDSVSTNSQGQEEHAISWVLTNSLHPLKNIVLSADAFGDISWSSPSAAAGNLTYDAQTKKILWQVAELPESVDVLNASFTLTINKKNPTQNTLLSKIHVQADDTVTGKKLDFMGEGISLGTN